MSAWDTRSRADDGGTVSVQDDVEEFAALLRRLKDRTERSYGSLARRLNMNTSTLHRYCAGEAVPQDFAPVERLAAFCEATPEERLELHRLWLSAVAARQRVRTGGSTEATVPVPGPSPDAGGALVEQGSSAEQPGDHSDLGGPASAPAPSSAPRPWYRRRRVLASTAVACALLATVGSMSALSDDRSSGADASRSADPRTAAPGTPRRSAEPSATTSPSASPSASRSSASPAPRREAPVPSATVGGPAASAKPAAGPPLTWSADSQVWDMGCGHDYVIDRPPAQVPPPPVQQDAGAWAATQDAVHGRRTMVQISVQGRSSTAVVLEALRVRVVSRGTPAAGSAYAMDQGCGGELTPRRFTVDLDVDRPTTRPKDGADSEHTIPAAHFPYRVSAEDPEVLLVDATTQTYDARWYLELDWSSQGRTGTVRIDDHGRPFRTSGIKGIQRYWYGTNDAGERTWVPYDSQG
ncbi:helix-turn-helix domain-containing protein [Streptomyces minutiscleroticus]|uniref:Transcriptional regulator n=1 Tax=Streptomyces minutiscleroticus TaxID=68238 RepID=A0A918U7S6_9ACTN|nr:transcriptional regulator [Streptomyces minutiscleroticus]